MLKRFKSAKNAVAGIFGRASVPSWKLSLNEDVILHKISDYLDLNGIKTCRCVSKEWEALFTSMISKQTLCFTVANVIEISKLKSSNKIIATKILFQNLKVDLFTENGLIPMKKPNITIFEINDGSLDVITLMRIALTMEKLEVLKISCAQNNQFNFGGDVINKGHFKDEKELLELLPKPIQEAKPRDLKIYKNDSPLLGDAAILLLILPLKYHIEQCDLELGKNKKKFSKEDYTMLPMFFSSLMNFMIKNAEFLKKLNVIASPTIVTQTKNERILFKEFAKAAKNVFLKYNGNHVLEELRLNFPGANLEKSNNYNRLKDFVAKLTNLEKFSIGPVQMKVNLARKIMRILPKKVNCDFSEVYMFQKSAKSLVEYGISTSTVSIAHRISHEDSAKVSHQQYTLRNFWPITNFEKTMESFHLELMTKLVIVQDKKFLAPEERLTIGDAQMKIIISKGKLLSRLHLECNLSKLSDRGLAGIKSRSVVNEVLKPYSDTLPTTAQLEQLKMYTKNSINNLTNLKSLVLLDCGEKLTDISAFLGLSTMKKLKEIRVTSPKLTALGRNVITQQFLGQDLLLHWDTS